MRHGTAVNLRVQVFLGFATRRPVLELRPLRLVLPGRHPIPVIVLAEPRFLAPRQAGSPNEAFSGRRACRLRLRNAATSPAGECSSALASAGRGAVGWAVPARLGHRGSAP